MSFKARNNPLSTLMFKKKLSKGNIQACEEMQLERF